MNEKRATKTVKLADVVRVLTQAKQPNRPVLVAIEGYGGAGKTTLAEKLKDRLKDAYVVSIDDFIVKENIMQSSWDNGAFDLKRLERQVLKPLASGKTSHYQKLLWEKNTLSDYLAIPKARYLIVEGISAYHPTIAGYYDYKIWVNAPIKIAKQRGQARDEGNENFAHWDVWAANDLAYQRKYHPERVADFVVDNA